jgi:hypothetical protein
VSGDWAPVDRTGAAGRRDRGRTRRTWLDELSAHVGRQHDQVDVEFAYQAGEQSLELSQPFMPNVVTRDPYPSTAVSGGSRYRSSFSRGAS